MSYKKTIWSVGGGKGGIGKSVATSNIGVALAQRGKEVILVDADLGGSNLHTYFGLKYPSKSLDDFLKGRCPTLADTAVETSVKGLRLITGGGEFLGIADPEYSRKQGLIEQIKNLDAEYIIVDLGAGSNNNTLDFFGISSEGIVVLAPEPAAIQNAYIFLKSFVYRRLQRLFYDQIEIFNIIGRSNDPNNERKIKTVSDLCGVIAERDRAAAERAIGELKGFRPRILLNMAASKEDVKVAEAFRNAAATFLSLDTEFIGIIFSRPAIKAAARKMRPFMLDNEAVDAKREINEIVSRLLSGARKEAEKPMGEDEEQEVFGFNDNVNHMGQVFHVQTEVQGGKDPVVETLVYHGGRIFFSKRSTLAELGGGASIKANLKDFAGKQHFSAITAIKTNRIAFDGVKR